VRALLPPPFPAQHALKAHACAQTFPFFDCKAAAATLPNSALFALMVIEVLYES
jgi:hypothetical protein